MSVLLLAGTAAVAQDADLQRPDEDSCGLSLLAMSRHRIVSAHMAPNFLTGRCYAFLPLEGAPKRGDVVTFPHAGVTHIMRLIGLPGDTVEMRAGRLVLNGTPVSTQTFDGEKHACGPGECDGEWLVETLPGGTAYLVLDAQAAPFDDTDPVTVPEGSVFVMGDNRDNAADSRIPGNFGGMGLIALDSLLRVAKVTE